MDVKKAARLLQLSVRVVRKLCREKKIPSKKVGPVGKWDELQLPLQYRTLTTKNVAGALGVSDRWVRKMCKEGKVRAVRLGRKWHIDSQDGATLIAIRCKC